MRAFRRARGIRTVEPLKRFMRPCLRRFGYDLVRHQAARDPVDSFVDLSEDERLILRAARPFTMTGLDRLAAVINAVKHVVQNGVPGDIAECGVWRGGSMMAAALTLRSLGDSSRTLYLYDTFEGMPAPTHRDRSFDGQEAGSLLRAAQRGTGIWCYAGLEDVQHNLFSTDYPRDKLVFVQGKVEETIPAPMPRLLSVLRLEPGIFRPRDLEAYPSGRSGWFSRKYRNATEARPTASRAATLQGSFSC